jgi:hypothetical protein
MQSEYPFTAHLIFLIRSYSNGNLRIGGYDLSVGFRLHDGRGTEAAMQ